MILKSFFVFCVEVPGSGNNGIRSIFITQHISGKLGLNKLSGEFLTNAQGGRDELEPR